MYRSFALMLITMSSALVACGPSSDAIAPSGVHGASHGAPSFTKGGEPSGQVMRRIAKLREATAPFHRFEMAEKANKGTQITGCFSDPALGGMGYHYGNLDLIDGTLDELEPELLLYEPMKNGQLRLVAVEYAVPFDAWTDKEPPMLFEQPFHRNEEFGLWVLHVWHERNNPRGMFKDWNPEVSCQYAR